MLRDLDLPNIATPTEELRSYLVGRYGDRFAIHPKKYEDIVAGVFEDFGYKVKVTSFTGDEGVDVVVFDGAGDITTAIQVKRQRGKVKAEQIRSFLGALILKGIPSGIFVTTSSYQKGAMRIAEQAALTCGTRIDLLDAERFYSALKISQKQNLTDVNDPESPYYSSWQCIDMAPLIYSYGW